MSASQHILVLGATGVSGIIFTRHVLSLPSSSQPKLTLYIRLGSRSKLPKDIQSESSIRVVEGALDDSTKLDEAMSGITTVVSFLGAYMSFVNFILRRTGPTPISDAMPTVCDVMRAHKVKRILALSTLAAFPQDNELRVMSWKWYLTGMLLPKIIVPQGHAEMVGIAKAVSKQEDLDWTVFRVPHLIEEDGEEVVAGHLGPDYKGTTELSRASLARWVLKEIEERK